MVHGVSAPRYWDQGEDDREFKWNNYISRYHSRHTDVMDLAAMYQARAYAPLHWRMAAVGITTYANYVVMFLPLLGLFTGLITPLTGAFFMAVAWGIIMLFNLVTLPVEFDASRRAKVVLADFGFIAPGEEATGVKKVLDAAAWTYVAAFITTLAYFLWHLLPLLSGGSRSRD